MRLRPVFLLSAIVLAMFICSREADGIHLIASPTQPPQETTQEVTPLEPGQSIERPLAGGQKHIYQVTLAENQYARVIVEQRGVDVVVRLLGPDGKQIADVDSVRGLHEEETVELVAEANGTYRLSVEAKPPNAPAAGYAIRFADSRAATAGDRALQEARRLSAESIRLLRAGKYAEALPLGQRALEIRARELGPENPSVAATLNNLCLIERSLGDLPKAEQFGQRAVEAWEKARGPEHPDVAGALSNLAVVLRFKGDYAKAEQMDQRALAIKEKAFGPEDPEVATSLTNLATHYSDTGDFAKAERFYQRAIAIWENALGPANLSVASAANGLGNLYKRTGDLARAAQFYQRALDIWEKALGPEHPNVAAGLSNLATVRRSLGDFLQAEELSERALKIYEKALGPAHPNLAYPLANLALIYTLKGDFTKAEMLHQRVLGIREKELGPNHPDVAASLNSLGLLYSDAGDLARAEPLFQRALSIWEKAFGAEHPNVAAALNNLATLEVRRGNFDKAEPLCRRALEIKEKALGPENPDVASSLLNLGEIYLSRGELAKAEELFERARRITEKALGPEHPEVSESLNSLARLYAAKGDSERAITSQSRANAITEQNLDLNIETGSERQKLAYLTSLSGITDRTISFNSAAPDSLQARRLAAITILQRKGRVLDAMSDSLTTLRQRLSPQDQSLIDRLRTANARLATLVLNGPQRRTLDEYRKQISGLEAERETLENDLSRRSAGFFERRAPVTLAAIQEAIPPDAALIEFSVYHPFDPRAAEDKAYGEPRYVAYVLQHQGEIQWKELGGVRQIDEAINSLREALRNPKSRDVQRLARAVDAKVMQPLRGFTRGAARLLISAEGSLNLIPFEALVDEQNRYLVELHSFSYLTSGRDLLRLQVKRDSRNNPLVMVDPSFGEPEVRGAKADTETARRNRSQGNVSPQGNVSMKRRNVTSGASLNDVYFAPLSGTEQEGQSIKLLFPEASVMNGTRATKAVLKQIAAPRILHIATHGFFLTDSPLGQTATGTRAISANMRIENPLLRSGLALAGANLRRRGVDDGVLTALEAAGLDLWGTKLVVLSACDTGIGEVKTGEGVYGLRRAFMLAGTETLVTSLWPVSDFVTREMMTSYYQGLKQGQGRGEALRQAQLSMLRRKTRQHPFYWAGFIQFGEWANLEGKR